MSNWTHVAAVFRVDSLTDDELDADKVFGKECVLRSSSDEDFKSFCDEWSRMVDNKSEYLPYGSEGSLRISVWTNPDSAMVARHVVTVWGDLRDKDDDSIEEIGEWFRNCCRKAWMRQAVCTVRNDYPGREETFTYKNGEFDEELKEKEKEEASDAKPE